REIAGRPALDAGVDPPASGRLARLETRDRQPVEDRAPVRAPVVPRGRLHRRVEGEAVEIRVLDPDPGERRELDGAAPGVGVERAPLVAPDLEADPDGREGGLDRVGEPARSGLVRGLVDDLEPRRGARAVGIAKAGAVEQPARAGGIVAAASD